MDASVFWSVIGAYNRQTVMLQMFLLALLSAALSVAYRHRRGRPAWLALGVAHLFIGIVFFGIYGTEPIQKYFAMPLFVLCGFLFLYEGIWHKSGVLDRPTRAQWVLLALYVLYPLISALLGNRFPTLVTHIMPCPVAYLGFVVYAGCRRKNVVLLGLLTLWGLTGVKSVIFQAYEDVILLLGGLYGLGIAAAGTCRRKAHGDKKHQGIYELTSSSSILL